MLWHAADYSLLIVQDHVLIRCHELGITLDMIRGAMREFPLTAATVRLVEELRAAGSRLAIISDANTYYIREILDASGVSDHFPPASVFTNPGEVDDLGRLRVRPFQEPGNPHGCPRCPAHL